jgi:tryptophan synthase beta chain
MTNMENKMMNTMAAMAVDEDGFYGEFGGAYVPEILQANVDELRAVYREVLDDPEFQAEFQELLTEYVGRPSPLYLARRLSERHGCRVYLKREDLNHTGAHKINNTIGQILMARRMGKNRIIAETGAGQHGVATATVCALMNMECVVYMGKTDVERQYLNVQKMRMLGAEVVAVTSGNMTLKDAVNEAIRDWCCHPADTHYIIGSTVGPHPYPDLVARLQSVISKEIRAQLPAKEGRDYPDYIVACVGGGSNAGGAIFDYLDDRRVKFLMAEAAGKGIETGESAATMHVGTEGILHGSKTLVMQTADGQVSEPYSISAGLDYPGVGPLQAHMARVGRSEVVAITDEEALAAALELTRLEGIIPALESAHALAALDRRRFSSEDVVVLCLSGRGDKDMETYVKYQES